MKQKEGLIQCLHDPKFPFAVRYLQANARHAGAAPAECWNAEAQKDLPQNATKLLHPGLVLKLAGSCVK